MVVDGVLVPLDASCMGQAVEGLRTVLVLHNAPGVLHSRIQGETAIGSPGVEPGPGLGKRTGQPLVVAACRMDELTEVLLCDPAGDDAGLDVGVVVPDRGIGPGGIVVGIPRHLRVVFTPNHHHPLAPEVGVVSGLNQFDLRQGKGAQQALHEADRLEHLSGKGVQVDPVLGQDSHPHRRHPIRAGNGVHVVVAQGQDRPTSPCIGHREVLEVLAGIPGDRHP